MPTTDCEKAAAGCASICWWCTWRIAKWKANNKYRFDLVNYEDVAEFISYSIKRKKNYLNNVNAYHAKAKRAERPFKSRKDGQFQLQGRAMIRAALKARGVA